MRATTVSMMAPSRVTAPGWRAGVPLRGRGARRWSVARDGYGCRAGSRRHRGDLLARRSGGSCRTRRRIVAVGAPSGLFRRPSGARPALSVHLRGQGCPATASLRHGATATQGFVAARHCWTSRSALTRAAQTLGLVTGARDGKRAACHLATRRETAAHGAASLHSSGPVRLGRSGEAVGSLVAQLETSRRHARTDADARSTLGAAGSDAGAGIGGESVRRGERLSSWSTASTSMTRSERPLTRSRRSPACSAARCERPVR